MFELESPSELEKRRNPKPPSNEKYLNYAAVCNDSDQSLVGEWIDSQLLVFRERTKTPSDFNPNEHCKCGCIKKITIVAHGRAGNPDISDFVSIQWGDTTLVEDQGTSGISDLFKGIKFCAECYIELKVCGLGKSGFLADRLKQNTKCNIQLYSDNVRACIIP